MNRRSLLATVGSGCLVSVSGCVGQLSAGPGSGDVLRPDDDREAAIEEYCSPADAPVSAQLTGDPGESDNCFDGAEPDLLLANDRNTGVDLTVELDQEATFEESFEMDPGERHLERAAIRADTNVTGSVTVDTETHEVTWPARSCRRHALVVTEDGLDVGWIAPLTGPEDTQHDCYAGDAVPTRLVATSSETVVVRLTDVCTDERTTETLVLEADDTERLDGLLKNGGHYDLDVDVLDGPTESYSFRKMCWGLAVHVDDEEVRARELDID